MSNGAITNFAIGGILGRAFGILKRNVLPFVIITATFVVLPTAIGGIVLISVGSTLEFGGKFDFSGIGAGFVALGIFSALCYFLQFATLCHGTICDLRGSRATIGASMNWALGRLFPVTGIFFVVFFSYVVVFGVALSIGFAWTGIWGSGFVGIFPVALLFAVPIFWLLTMWWIAVPVTVTERVGVFASLGRSATLTHGHRRRVLAIIVIVYTGNLVIDRLFSMLFKWAPYFSLAASIAIMVVATAYIAVVTAVCYHDLRVLKDGVGIDDIAKVFD